MRIAGIGSRELAPEQLEICRTLGAWAVQQGHELFSGNAEGADYAFATGGNSVDPTRVNLMLPWRSYNERQLHPDNRVASVEDLYENERKYYTALAQEHHPAWPRLSRGARLLHMRNGLILCPPTRKGSFPVDLCLAWPSQKPGGGGTGQGMRIAQALGIRLVDLSLTTRGELHALCEELRKKD